MNLREYMLDLLVSGIFPSSVAIILVALGVLIPEILFRKRRQKSESILISLANSSDKIIVTDKIKFDDAIDELIKNHHKQALLQATVQFWISIFAAFFGFVFIVAVILLSPSTEWYEGLINAIPGIVIEAVSVLFFTQSKETRQQSSDFLNRLRQDRLYEKSIAIANEIQDEQLKAKLKAEIALHLCGINKSPNDL
jgi:hypothetical protein